MPKYRRWTHRLSCSLIAAACVSVSLVPGALAQEDAAQLTEDSGAGERVKVVLKSGRVVRGVLLGKDGGNYRIERAPGDVVVLPETFVSSVERPKREPQRPAREVLAEDPRQPAPPEPPAEVPEPEPDPIREEEPTDVAPDAPEAPEVETVTVKMKTGFVLEGALISREDGALSVRRGPGDVVVVPESAVESIDGVLLRPALPEQPADAARPEDEEPVSPEPVEKDVPRTPQRPVAAPPERGRPRLELLSGTHWLMVFTSSVLGQSLGTMTGALVSTSSDAGPAVVASVPHLTGAVFNAGALRIVSWTTELRSEFMLEKMGRAELAAGFAGSAVHAAFTLPGFVLLVDGVGIFSPGEPEKVRGGLALIGTGVILSGVTSTALYMRGVRNGFEHDRSAASSLHLDATSRSERNLRPRVGFGFAPSLGGGGTLQLDVRF